MILVLEFVGDLEDDFEDDEDLFVFVKCMNILKFNEIIVEK